MSSGPQLADAEKDGDAADPGPPVGHRPGRPPREPVDDGSDRAPPEVTRYVPTARPGARLPHAWLSDDHSLYDELGEGFSLLTFGAETAPLEAATRSLGLPLTVVDMAGRPELRDRYAADLVLVRPDQHVAWRGAVSESPADLLRRVIGAQSVSVAT